MEYETSPFHRFFGWKIAVLFIVTACYGFWHSNIGPYADLANLAPGLPLEERGFYTGQEAVTSLSDLNVSGQRTKLWALVLDIPNFILLAFLMEALIAFGIRRLKLIRPIWNLLFVFPILFLLVDFAEDSFVALTLVTLSEGFGSVAGVLTVAKFGVFSLTTLIAIILSLTGLVYWLMQDRKS